VLLEMFNSINLSVARLKLRMHLLWRCVSV
jgi:hypothetical protein